MEMYSETQVLMENLSLRQDDCPEALLEYGRALLYQVSFLSRAVLLYFLSHAMLT